MAAVHTEHRREYAEHALSNACVISCASRAPSPPSVCTSAASAASELNLLESRLRASGAECINGGCSIAAGTKSVLLRALKSAAAQETGALATGHAQPEPYLTWRDVNCAATTLWNTTSGANPSLILYVAYAYTYSMLHFVTRLCPVRALRRDRQTDSGVCLRDLRSRSTH